MTSRLETLSLCLKNALGERIMDLREAVGEISITVKPVDWSAAARVLCDDSDLRFEQLSDLCGVDYQDYGDGAWNGPRFAVVCHLLSLTHNWRLRVKAFAEDDQFPVFDSLISVWPSANWYEREAFDLFGMVFTGHPDLRRILTDYGFIGHPFRKDFPLSGNVEMRYDPDLQRVIYQPVTIDPRNNVPRVVREENYADSEGFRKG
ncbi:MAG TPA: NADH-quinone oxidoreductase subunit C [Burkholderiales bacterium]|nr:NADH-quinone oxidoreductase subunit C [Burkholderiales bacterium]